ncbi:Protein SUPPRESSOR OF GENE SILENCING [Castilleja foliolosa]|uniref:Protein SUPPRESSOR OF GENE SILENCING n=1 Tax=Castilleja foliolosa TaxID=1961234 RepID=A0ABD3BBM4_9LAMI
MSSSKGSGAAPNASFKGKGTSDDQLSHAVLDMNLNSSQDDGWEEYGKKSKIKNRSNASKQINNSDTMQKLGLRSHGGFARGNGQLRPTAPPDTKKHPSGRGFTKPQSSNQAAVIPPPLENGWGWSSRAGSTQPSENGINAPAVIHPASNQSSVVDDVNGGEDSGDIDDSDDELLSDGFDSDKSQKSHETRGRRTELLEYFSAFAVVRSRHSYGPNGHRGMIVLIFDALAVGYVEAERLNKHFENSGRDRLAWERNNRVLFYAGGKRQLYGYMAEKHDMDSFNYHSQGKSKLKYEMRSYQEMVVDQMKQMSEDNQQLTWLKHKIAKEQKNKRALKLQSYKILIYIVLQFLVWDFYFYFLLG